MYGVLDLDSIFDPDVVETTVLARYGEVSVESLPGDWRVWFEERAAIKEYDGGLPRERAEAEALAETVRMMRASKRRIQD
ncbi:MAG TPA: hypothetical protein DCX07_14350 [Phycisphaerales bacterium]|nr:hypothetical protein [Phycisphaerales bacterium]